MSGFHSSAPLWLKNQRLLWPWLEKNSYNYGEVHVYSFGMDIFKQYIFSLNEERKYVQQKFNFILPILSQYSYLGNMKYESSII